MNKTTVLRWLKGHFFILSCIVAGVVFVLLVAYRFGDAMSVSDAIVASQQRLESINNDQRNSLTLEEDAERLKGYASIVDSSLVNLDAKAESLAYFYEVGTECKVKVLHVEQREVNASSGKMDSKKAKVKPAFEQVQFDIGIEGSFASVLGYVEEVRKGHPIMRVDSFVLKPSGNASGRMEEASLLVTVLAKVNDKNR